MHPVEDGETISADISRDQPDCTVSQRTPQDPGAQQPLNSVKKEKVHQIHVFKGTFWLEFGKLIAGGQGVQWQPWSEREDSRSVC